jgi:hypothetical protein
MSEFMTQDKRCPRCLMPLSAPGITQMEDGTCSVCRDYRPAEVKGEASLRSELAYPSEQSREYACVVPISGGLDSVYTAFYLTHHMGLRCVGVHFDHGMGSENKPRMLAWIERELDMPIVVRGWPQAQSEALVRDSIRAMLLFGPQSMQAALCRHCGYGIRAVVYSEMVARGLHSVWGTHTMDTIPFRYCRSVKPSRYVFQRRGFTALRALRGRYRQARALPSPGTSALTMMRSPMGYPAMPKSHAHLKVLSLFQYIPWNKNRMLDELQQSGVDIQPLSRPHSDCQIAPVVDRVLQSAWTVGKKEVYICNLIRDGQLSRDEGLRQIAAARESPLDTVFLQRIGLSDTEIAEMFRA